MIGIGAIKYADLSQRSHQGLRVRLGAHARRSTATPRRTCSTRTPASAASSAGPASSARRCAPSCPSLGEPQERALALQLLQFDAAVHDTLDKFSPHRLCTYLFELAPGVHRVLRGLPGVEGRLRGDSRQPPRAVRPHRPRAASRASRCSASTPRSGCEPGPAAAAARHRGGAGRRLAVHRWLRRRRAGRAVRHARCSSTTRRTCAPAAARPSRTFGLGRAVYATKAFLCTAMARLAYEEGMLLDVASGGELFVALRAGVPAAALTMHGNNKSIAELRMAITEGVRHIVVDSFDELDRLDALHAEGLPVPKVLARITPGVHAHTHEFIATGQDDSKFGFNLGNGDAHRAIDRMRRSPSVQLRRRALPHRQQRVRGVQLRQGRRGDGRVRDSARPARAGARRRARRRLRGGRGSAHASRSGATCCSTPARRWACAARSASSPVAASSPRPRSPCTRSAR